MRQVKYLARQKNKQRGDTLIEVAFALVIIGFIVAVAIQGAIKAHQAAVTARKRTQATFIAKSQFGMLKALRNYYMHTPNGGWGTDGSDPSTVLGQLKNLGMVIPAPPSPDCSAHGGPSGAFYAYPRFRDFTVPYYGTPGYDSSSSINLVEGEINGAATLNSVTDLFGFVGELKIGEVAPTSSSSSSTLREIYANNFIGFTVSNTAYLTCSRYGVNDVTVETTVTWQDGSGHDQEVMQINRLSNNI